MATVYYNGKSGLNVVNLSDIENGITFSPIKIFVKTITDLSSSQHGLLKEFAFILLCFENVADIPYISVHIYLRPLF